MIVGSLVIGRGALNGCASGAISSPVTKDHSLKNGVGPLCSTSCILISTSNEVRPQGEYVYYILT